MKTIQIDDDLYQFIAANTQQIGESASDILRRLLWQNIDSKKVEVTLEQKTHGTSSAQGTAVTEDDADLIIEPPLEQPVSSQAVEAANQVENTTNSANDTVICKDTSVFNLLNKEEVATQKGAVGRFLFVLAKLHRAHSDRFKDVMQIKGRERNYFGLSASELEASGSSIKPKQIPNSEFWVTTNNNTPRKKFIVFEVAKQLGYEEAEAEKLRELI